MSEALMSTYARYPITIVKGKGSYVWDDQNNQYLDFTSGIATCNLGHVPDVVKEKIEEQLQNLWHCSNLYHIPNQQKLAELLVENSCFDQVFFCNSGAEANEAAIKLARRYAQKIKGKDAYEVVTFKQSFHGRTLATLTATGQEKIQDGFSPLVPGFRYLQYNDMSDLDQVVQSNTCAVLLELVQGEGGVIPADMEWVKQLYQLCKEHNILFMVDEIQTGMGRTGRLFAYEHYDIEPDVISLAKGLGSGFPIGAIMAKLEVSRAFEPGSHGSTFGGNPLATSAAIATIEYLSQSNALHEAESMGDYLEQKLQQLAKQFEWIEAVRGKGLLQGLVVKVSAQQIVEQARAKQVLILSAGPNVVRILPPLTTSIAEIDRFISILQDILSSYDV